ncbi:T6SS immunity protein Tli4 family protein [Sapientia aquatica]|uniref:Tle cognate immunity protein 4 C-terminal domain-containing protein n=1 Tax=Sapientia aquatica TaxID=1549640 RepID=A0A4R5VWA6_9BURK|nr:T6SS immunity protein Tli4 family protein [Sapientia aquatica]TDK63455.1 hypothetical protein E2I14_14685 [Sapientia aquatica]
MKLSRQTKQTCLGRVIFTLPVEFNYRTLPQDKGYTTNADIPQLSLLPTTFKFGLTKDWKRAEVGIVSLNANLASFTQTVQEQIAALKTVINGEDKVPMLKEIIKVTPSNYVIKRYSRTSINDYFAIDIHLLRGKTHLIVTTGPDENITNYDSITQNIMGNTTTIDFTRPIGPGFCLGDALINSNHDYEISDDDYAVVGLEGLNLTVRQTNTQDQATGTLLQRVDSQRREFAPAFEGIQFKGLRRGVTNMAGLPAEELLQYLSTEKERTMFYRVETTPGETPTLQRPVLIVHMSDTVELLDSARRPIKELAPSLSEEDALWAFDTIKNSMRLR